VIKQPSGRHPYTARTYLLKVFDLGHRIRFVVRATNAWGAASATSRPTAIIHTAGTIGGTQPGQGPTPAPSPAPAPTGGGATASYFATVPSSETGSPPAGIPRPDATCAAQVTPTAENRPQNTTANHSVPSDPASIDWGSALNYWTKFVGDRDHVTGDFTGATDEILQWVACKWGIDLDLVRADTVVESYWVQSTVGDNCGVAGEASYGLLQVKNKDCSGNWVHGGWPYTQSDTALDVDYWGARLRACFDGAFYDGGQWLYGGQTIAQVIAQHGEDYALWGCVGSWFSGNWYDSGAQSYIVKVQADYQSKPWLKPGF
jgi:autotransporter family porin